MAAGCDISWLLVWQEIFSLSMGFSRHEYWSGLPFPPPGDLPNPEIEPMSLLSPALGGSLFTTELPGKSNSHLNREESQYKVADELNCRWQQCRLQRQTAEITSFIMMAVVLRRDGISEAPYKLYHKHPTKKTAQQRGKRTWKLWCQRQRQNSWLTDGMALGNGMKCLESQF